MVTRARKTALFLVIALGGSFAIGAVWVAHPERGWISQYLMWTPGIAALVLQLVRREAPRAEGFQFTGAGQWVVGFVYPFGMIAACVGLGYLIQAFSGADIIHFKPETVRLPVFGAERTGMELVALRLAICLLFVLPWCWPWRIATSCPRSWRILRKFPRG
jgi:hypothetical protein